jgi:hypothetical protein
MMLSIMMMTAALAITAATRAVAVVPSPSISSQSNQTASNIQQSYNATENMISTFKTTDSLLIQALNDLNMSKTHEASTLLGMAKTQLEQHQLASLDALSNPVLQLSGGAFIGCSTGFEDGKN